MKKASVVIGAGLGDEGKGVVTSTLAQQHDIVVRFCGGANAAHHVNVLGKEHTFHHFGSGTLSGLPTYLEKEFIINPIFFYMEYCELLAKGITPIVYINPKCRISTPFDMMMNQALELSRKEKGKNNIHGTTGMGINETVIRSIIYNQPFTIETIKLLFPTKNKLTGFLNILFDEYYLHNRGLNPHLNPEWFQIHLIRDIISTYVDDIFFLLMHTVSAKEEFLFTFDRILFEGSQGLLLDSDYGEYPYVTNARTGMTNILELFDRNHLSSTIDIDVYYVTRHYRTRHGAGPLKNQFLPQGNIIDTVNIKNNWQGEFKYGLLDLDLLRDTIGKDFVRKNNVNNHLVVTCMDQCFKNGYMIKGTHTPLNKEEFLEKLKYNVLNSLFYTDSPMTLPNLKKA